MATIKNKRKNAILPEQLEKLCAENVPAHTVRWEGLFRLAALVVEAKPGEKGAFRIPGTTQILKISDEQWWVDYTGIPKIAELLKKKRCSKRNSN